MDSRTQSKLILVVDDNEDDRTFVRNALKHVAPDVTVAEVTDGVEAMAYLRDEARAFPDLVLLDLKMPRKDGIETLTEIRLDPNLRFLPVVAVFTTAVDPQYVRRAYDVGANAYVGKPSNITDLEATMAGIVAHWFRIATLPTHPSKSRGRASASS